MVDTTIDRHAQGAADSIGRLDAEARADLDRIDDGEFGRLVRLVRDNERLTAELEATRSRAHRAWSYLAMPGANPALALAELERLRHKRSAILAHLRANRVAARALLGAGAPGGFDAIGIDECNLN